MNRRDLLQALGLVAASAPWLSCESATSSVACAGVTPVPGRHAAAFALDASMRQLVGAIADTVIPRTDTPAASEAGVVDFIDFMLGKWFSAQERAEFMGGLNALEANSQAVHGVSFSGAQRDTRTEMLVRLEDQATVAGSGILDARSFISRMKLLVLTGFYTSQVGAATELDNSMLFSAYEGCVAIGHDDRAQSRAVPAPSSL